MNRKRLMGWLMDVEGYDFEEASTQAERIIQMKKGAIMHQADNLFMPPDDREETQQKKEEQPVAEQWEELENFDSELIISNDMETEVYYHQLSKSYDYTKNGWARLARENNLSVVGEKIEELDDKYRVIVYVRRYMTVKGVTSLIEVDRIGAHEEMKVQFGKNDPFAFTKAVSKAVRNGYKEHMRGHPDITQAKLAELYRQQQPNTAKIPPAPPKQQPAPAPPKQSQSKPPKQAAPPPPKQAQSNGNSDEDWKVTKRKEMFATYNENKVILEDMGINEKTLAEGMYAKYSVGSRADMTAEQYEATTEALRFVAPDSSQFAQWIRDLAKPKEEVIDGDEIPFSSDPPPTPPAQPDFKMRVTALLAVPFVELQATANKWIDGWRKSGLLSMTMAEVTATAKEHYGVDMNHKTRFALEDYAHMVATFEKDELPDWLKE